MSAPETVFQGRRFNVVRKRFRAADGTEHVNESVQHPGAVTIIPMVDEQRVCLIRNRRPAVDQTLIELPAGTLEPGELPLDTARRELEEETGYRAESIELLCQFFTSPGILNERMHLYLATGLHAGSTNLDAGEQIENMIVDWMEALAMCHDGRIQDAKSLVGILFYESLRRKATSH
ncbi:MAG TPA: NUDIX hydrolase [Pirellulales bacterium]|jgi:ADP-ribose pyrophosphatase|nr:NUDIX hydrolase [Pirellulales bacterium]